VLNKNYYLLSLKRLPIDLNKHRGKPSCYLLVFKIIIHLEGLACITDEDLLDQEFQKSFANFLHSQYTKICVLDYVSPSNLTMTCALNSLVPVLKQTMSQFRDDTPFSKFSRPFPTLNQP